MKQEILKKLGISAAAALLLILLLAFGLSRFLAMYTHHEEKIPVPILYGLGVPEVENLLGEIGLRYEIRDSLFDETKPRNSVIQQDPDTGEFVKEGRVIYLSINSSEVPKIRMPDLDHKNIHQAIMILESLGLKVGRIDTVPNIAEDAVLDWRLNGKQVRPDTEIAKGSVIDLTIADGGDDMGVFEGNAEVPDLEGTTLGEAQVLLEAYGLRLGSVIGKGEIRDSSQATILSQIPSYSPGLEIRKGSRVSVTIKQ
ncbi:MAG: PASTA domain-containing protein [Bacteroidia bacterium]